jgi:hypothetical protein
MTFLRYNVFGRIVAIRKEDGQWRPYYVGNEGKRSEAGFVIPDFVAEDELGQYLFDLFHENARPANNAVTKLD